MSFLSAAVLSIPPDPPPLFTLSLHDALPILHDAHRPCTRHGSSFSFSGIRGARGRAVLYYCTHHFLETRCVRYARAACFRGRDRKSTRLNSSHRCISYAVFCLKKKNKQCNQL